MNSTPITTSVFDLFKIGPGPSSSHTIGPMKAAFDFLERLQNLPDDQLEKPRSVDIYLYGSLSATGKGHGTDRAIVAGLLGWQPETVDPDELLNLLKDPAVRYPVRIGGTEVFIGPENIHFERKRYNSPYANTMVLRCTSGRLQPSGDTAGNIEEAAHGLKPTGGPSGNTLLEEEYYSIGGGFVLRKGEPEAKPAPVDLPFPYSTMKELRQHLTRHPLTLEELLLRNEEALTGRSRRDIYRRLDGIVDAMHRAVKRGLKQRGVLPGSIKLQRKAPILYKQACGLAQSSDSFLIFLNAYCLAASEENAAGGIVVTAPTSGASGVIPGLTYLARHHFHYDRETLRRGMLAAAAIGFLVKHNASISGAEMGCMGEIGTASAMGAAFLTYCAGKPIESVEAAAEICIEHHLGMTCDPIGGYVQIPCIERNAMGAVKAYNAFLLATSGAPALQKITLDSVIKVMKATGRDMSTKYKETSEAGLALSATEC
ncbi:L-serine ammonia-lyase, iron-sulfur-dependent, subunit alpha [Tellurirhabdus rosea]|uniref:L-serine ammonia-lyase, iron-sulfur-dependent, subunit alpha n=1 Tax=Tellurirhabdus rosea TaxID=2674997 RepID=UPI00224CE322|nr:L-serine ammonia-lyase, iron-sulfur-dependent, subunit alpha [Tellurirhabdus rosea]